jgi:SagB-type dehydrogenase family enzyme
MTGNQSRHATLDGFRDVIHYHEETKHHPGRYARSSGYMDWENQPDPFRCYEGTVAINLPLLVSDPKGDHLDLYRSETRDPCPVSLSNISGMLELSLGLSVWKSVGGSSWALRMNPSSGNLHPTECHLILPPLESHTASIAHYNVYRHSLEVRAAVSSELWQRTEAHFKGQGFLVILAGIPWRESWKYGERALRYTQHDVGHAASALCMAANLFGWQVTYLGDASDSDLEKMIGLNQVPWRSGEAEVADLAVWVHGRLGQDLPRCFGEDLVNTYADLSFQGVPNPLSAETARWEIIDHTFKKLQKPATCDQWDLPQPAALLDMPVSLLGAAAIIRQRRSAQRFNDQGSISSEVLFAILDKTMQRPNVAPFSLGLGPPCVDLLLFVHRVTGLASGLYVLLRSGEAEGSLRRHMSPEFEWTKVHAALPLFRLKEGNFEEFAAAASCLQDIAGSSAVSFAMLARFESIIAAAPWRYKTLFWETGMIGQVLYLEAEAYGVRGTGIGCYFDDVVHRLLGFEGCAFQSLYHFTIGEPIDDPRLLTLPAYHHLPDSVV